MRISDWSSDVCSSDLVSAMPSRQDAFAALAAALLVMVLLALPPVQALRGVSTDLLFWLRARTVETAPAIEQPVAVIALDEETYRTPPFRDTPNALWTPQLARLLDRSEERRVGDAWGSTW